MTPRVRLVAMVVLTLCALSPVTTAGARRHSTLAVTVREAAFLCAGDSAQVRLVLTADGTRHADPHRALLVEPWLVAGADSVRLPLVGYYGDRPWYHYVRYGADPLLADSADLRIRAAWAPDTLVYVRHVRYQPWMEHALLRVVATDAACCDAADGATRLLSQQPVSVQTLVPARPVVEQRTYSKHDQAQLSFVVNRTDINPAYRRNARELRRVQATIDSVRRDTAVRVQTVTFRGYASPEGRYDHNATLARQRTESLQRYVTAQYHLPDSIVSATSVPEDWEGLRRYVDTHRNDPALPHSRQLLQVIDMAMDPDERLALIAANYPAEYRYLLANCFPLLRRIEYTIAYTRREVRERPGETDTITTLPHGRLTYVDYPVTSRLRPLLALKTNLLFDAALAPNVEVEVPLGADSRWSVAAEYWIPWYVWHHNSRAYEVQTLGLEARRYLRPRCTWCRPQLTGTFLGLYLQTGKYDVEWSSRGYQGEFTSCGLTVGRSWLLSRHWNLEASVSAGALWGPQRYYRGEFNDTHLIWQHDDHLTYVGPTKLKLSVAYLVGTTQRKAKKGGRP